MDNNLVIPNHSKLIIRKLTNRFQHHLTQYLIHYNHKHQIKLNLHNLKIIIIYLLIYLIKQLNNHNNNNLNNNNNSNNNQNNLMDQIGWNKLLLNSQTTLKLLQIISKLDRNQINNNSLPNSLNNKHSHYNKQRNNNKHKYLKFNLRSNLFLNNNKHQLKHNRLNKSCNYPFQKTEIFTKLWKSWIVEMKLKFNSFLEKIKFYIKLYCKDQIGFPSLIIKFNSNQILLLIKK